MQLANSLKKYIFLKKILSSNLKLLNLPYKLTFALTYRCNLKCKTCLIWTKKPVNELSAGDMDLFFNKSNRFSWIDLTGGEIFLREDLPEIIDIVLNRCQNLAILHFPTNGQLTEKIIATAENIARQDKVTLVITVSIDGPEHIHNEIRGSKYAWHNAVSTFTGLKKSGIKHVYIGYTVSHYNIGKINEAVSEIKRIYPDFTYDDLHVNFFHISEHYLNNTSMHSLSENLILNEIHELMVKKQKIGIKSILERRFFKLIPAYLSSKKMPIKCHALYSSIFIGPNGAIYPCSIYNKKTLNIRDIDFDLKKLWNNKKIIVEIRNEIHNKKCSGCWTPCEAYPAILGSLPICLI